MRTIARFLVALLLAIPFAASTHTVQAQTIAPSVTHKGHRIATLTPRPSARGGKMQTALR
jgi:hypothetical protein